MGFLTAIIDALAEFVRRNPIFTLIVVVLALTAPALLKGIALFVLYLVLGFLVLIFALSLLFRWRIRRVQRQMEEQQAELENKEFRASVGGAVRCGRLRRCRFRRGPRCPYGEPPGAGGRSEGLPHERDPRKAGLRERGRLRGVRGDEGAARIAPAAAAAPAAVGAAALPERFRAGAFAGLCFRQSEYSGGLCFRRPGCFGSRGVFRWPVAKPCRGECAAGDKSSAGIVGHLPDNFVPLRRPGSLRSIKSIAPCCNFSNISAATSS